MIKDSRLVQGEPSAYRLQIEILPALQDFVGLKMLSTGRILAAMGQRRRADFRTQ
jgi:hypothetical protein